MGATTFPSGWVCHYNIAIEKRLWSIEDVVALVNARSEKISGNTVIA